VVYAPPCFLCQTSIAPSGSMLTGSDLKRNGMKQMERVRCARLIAEAARLFCVKMLREMIVAVSSRVVTKRVDHLHKEVKEHGIPAQKSWWEFEVLRIEDPDGNDLLVCLENLL
jgi:hypothetical protein